MTAIAGSLAIRPLRDDEPAATFQALARVLADAYPMMRLTTTEALAERAERIAHAAREEHTAYVIAQRDGELAGVMRLYDYRMNVRGREALTGGVGSVAVAPAHRRHGVARALLVWYLERYRERGATFAILHPFRTDFYRALGFGYGTPSHRYRFAPATVRYGEVRGTARMLGSDDLQQLQACSERVRVVTNGLIAQHRAVTARLLADPALRYVGIEDGGQLRAFMQTSAAPAADVLRNRDELVVRDLTYEEPVYLAALLRYLHAQSDQFARIVIESQDPALYLASRDPRDGSDEAVAVPATHRVATTGLGVMYRVLDLDAAFGHLAPASQAFALRVEVDDVTLPSLHGERTFRFGPNAPPCREDASAPDAILRIGIPDLSSLLVGSLRLRDVVRLGLASVGPADRLAMIDAAFAADEPPICTTRF